MIRLDPSQTIFLCSLCLSIVSAGCQSEGPAPGSSKSKDSTQSAAVAEPNEPDMPFEPEDGFTLLTRDDFDAFGTEPDTWTSTSNGKITCTGKPRGYLYSHKSYKNFTLRLEYRFPRPENLKDDSKFKGNTGFLVYITGEHKLWPASLEVQGRYAQMATIKENGGVPPVVVEDDAAARESARKPVGQWNEIEVVSTLGALNVLLNGSRVSNSKPESLTAGLIGIQSEDFPFEVRRMRIRID